MSESDAVLRYVDENDGISGSAKVGMRDESAMSSEWPPMGGYPSIPTVQRISPLASIGTPGEDARKPIETCPNHGVCVGVRTTIREFVTVHGGFERTTTVGDDCYLMAKSHVGHDAQLSDGVTLCTGAIVGGYTHMHEGSTLGLGAITHPNITIGAYAYVGAGSVVIRDVPPFAKVAGVPAKQIGWNTLGMERAGFTPEQIETVSNGGLLSGPAAKHYVKYEEERGRYR